MRSLWRQARLAALRPGLLRHPQHRGMCLLLAPHPQRGKRTCALSRVTVSSKDALGGRRRAGVAVGPPAAAAMPPSRQRKGGGARCQLPSRGPGMAPLSPLPPIHTSYGILCLLMGIPGLSPHFPAHHSPLSPPRRAAAALCSGALIVLSLCCCSDALMQMAYKSEACCLLETRGGGSNSSGSSKRRGLGHFHRASSLLQDMPGAAPSASTHQPLLLHTGPLMSR
jgi:hypothetical protein